jgi:rare lipoprotein A
MKQRWLIVMGLLLLCQVDLAQVDLAVAASRSPSLLQRILSVFTPRPVRRVHVTATDHAGLQTTESPRVKPIRAAQPLDAPSEAPPPFEATRFAESAPAGEPAPLVEAPPAIMPPQPALASKKAKRSDDMQAAQMKKAAQPLPAAPHWEVVQTTQKPQPPLAEPSIERVEAVPVAQPEPASRPIQTAQMFKAANKVRSVKTTQSPPAPPVQPAPPMQVAILGIPNLKAALPEEGAAPVEQPRSDDGPARPESKSACNGGRRIVSAYYWEGRHTASGQAFNPHAMTAAHRTLPFGTRLDVTNPRTVNVLINDRGPFVRGVSLDLSLGAAQAIGLHGTGSVCIL